MPSNMNITSVILSHCDIKYKAEYTNVVHCIKITLNNKTREVIFNIQRVIKGVWRTSVNKMCLKTGLKRSVRHSFVSDIIM